MVAIAYPFLVSLAAALVVRDQTPKPLSFTLNKQLTPKLVKPPPLGDSSNKTNNVDNKPSKHAASQNIDIYADSTSYLINLGLINQDQEVEVLLDSGSSDLWVDASKLNDTSGFTKNGELFGIIYGDGLTVVGDFGTSPVWLDNGVEVKDVQWALATDVRIDSGKKNGILGIGKEDNESPVHNKKPPYPNFTQKLKDEGLISTNGYSYFLNTINATSGTITFGGRDLAKVKGPVATLTPNTNDEDSAFDSITISKFATSNGQTSGPVEVVLDTGTTFSFLPFDTLQALAVPYTGWDESGTWYIEHPAPDKYVSFFIGDIEIKLLYADLAIPETDANGKPTGKYLFGLQSTERDPYILGDTFLRFVYVTVNHDDNQVLISDVNYTDEENIVSL